MEKGEEGVGASGVGLGRWMVGASEPSDIFDSIGMNALELLTGLDDKLFSLTGGKKPAKSAFFRWLAAFRQFSSVIAFHGGEIISEGKAPLTAVAIGRDGNDILGLRMADERLKLDFIAVAVISWNDLCRSTLEGDGALLRSYSASELLLLFNCESDIQEWEMHSAMSRLVFEEHPIEDLSWMIAQDVKFEVLKKPGDFDELDFSGRKPVQLKRVGQDDFASIAKKAMKRRRVSSDVHGPLMEGAKKLLTRGL